MCFITRYSNVQVCYSKDFLSGDFCTINIFNSNFLIYMSIELLVKGLMLLWEKCVA